MTELPLKYCAYCSANIRRGKYMTYEIGVCSKCIHSRPEFEDILKASNRERQNKFYRKKMNKEAV